MDCTLARDTPLVKFSSESVHYFVSNPADGQNPDQNPDHDRNPDHRQNVMGCILA